MFYRMRCKADDDENTHIDHDLFSDLAAVSMGWASIARSYVEDTDKRPVCLCDGLVRLFSVSYPAIVVVDGLVWVPSTILERGQCG